MVLTPHPGPHQPRQAGTHRVHDGAAYFAHESGPLLLVLLLPILLVTYVALEGFSVERSSPAGVANGGDGFRYEYRGVGVKRLVHDGAGHYPGDRLFLHKPDSDVIAFEPDGSTLLCCDDPGLILGETTNSRLVRLGEAAPVAAWDDTRLVLDDASHMAVSDEATVWLSGPGLASLSDDGWTVHHQTGGYGALAVGLEGSTWTDAGGTRLRILQLRDGVRRIHASGQGLPAAAKSWAPAVTGIAVTPDGDVWVGVSGQRPRQTGGLLRYDGERWAIARPLGKGVDVRVEGLTVAPDGMLWAYLSRDARTKETNQAKRPVRTLLASYDGEDWTVLRESDGVPRQGARTRGDTPNVLMAAGPNGALWMTPVAHDGCRELVLFREGEATRPLDTAACVEELELDAHGTAWAAVEWSRSRGADAWRTEIFLIDA